jgi:hypothetical protein
MLPAVVLKEEHKGQSNLRDSPRGAYLTEKRGIPMSDLERRRYLDQRRRRGREVQIDLFLRPILEYQVVSPSDLVGEQSQILAPHIGQVPPVFFASPARPFGPYG